MRKKAESIERDQYAILVATERCTDLIASHELHQDGPIEIRLEFGTNKGWDDIYEVRKNHQTSHLEHHRWQIKRQSTDLNPQAISELILELRDSPEIEVAHLGFRDAIAVKNVGSLRVLRDLAARVKKPGIDLDYILTDLNRIERMWCEFIREAASLPNTRDALLLLRRLGVDFLGDESQLRDFGVSRLRVLYLEPDEIWSKVHTFVSRSVDGAVSITYDLLYEHILTESEKRVSAVVDIWIWKDNFHRISIDDTLVPVKQGDRLQIEISLNRKAYMSVVWINSDGISQPIYPWKQPGDWNSYPEEGEQQETARLLLPAPNSDDPYCTWSVNTDRGIETAVLLVSEIPLSKKSWYRFRDALTGFPSRAEPADIAKVYRLECRKRDLLKRKVTRLNLHGQPITDPIYQIHNKLKERLGPWFALIYAISFANTGNMK